MDLKAYTTYRPYATDNKNSSPIRIEEIDLNIPETLETIDDVLNYMKDRFHNPPTTLKDALDKLSIPYREIEWSGPIKTRIGKIVAYSIRSEPINKEDGEWIIDIRIQN